MQSVGRRRRSEIWEKRVTAAKETSTWTFLVQGFGFRGVDEEDEAEILGFGGGMYGKCGAARSGRCASREGGVDLKGGAFRVEDMQVEDWV